MPRHSKLDLEQKKLRVLPSLSVANPPISFKAQPEHRGHAAD
jgi:hypothetical protein